MFLQVAIIRVASLHRLHWFDSCQSLLQKFRNFIFYHLLGWLMRRESKLESILSNAGDVSGRLYPVSYVDEVFSTIFDYFLVINFIKNIVCIKERRCANVRLTFTWELNLFKKSLKKQSNFRMISIHPSNKWWIKLTCPTLTKGNWFKVWISSVSAFLMSRTCT